MRIGYARVSTADQNLESQIDALQKAGCERIFQEKASGARADRPERNRMIDMLREDDTVVVTKLNRIGRNTKDLISISELLDEKGVNLIILDNNIDTTTPLGKMFFTVMAAIAEFERELIVEGTKEGLASARACGRVGGRPRINSITIQNALDMHESGKYSISEILAETGIGKTTLYKYLGEAKAQAEEKAEYDDKQ